MASILIARQSFAYEVPCFIQGAVVEGVACSGKNVDFERFIGLPRRSKLPLEIAMNGRAPPKRMRDNGWRIRDPYEASKDPSLYRDCLANSLGEWSVAKNAYVASSSGWFSCRSACYLSLGVPVLVQHTGFGCALPRGEGFLAFSTLEEAQAVIEELAAAPERHSRAAREIAQVCFDVRKVLTRLLEQAL